ATVDLMELVTGEFLAQVIPEERVDVRGPPVALSGKAATSLGLALHELTTNSIKFGALATPAGGLSVHCVWDAQQPTNIRLEWRERGVALAPDEPRHHGFGTELIERTLPYELRARTSLEFTSDGVRSVIVFDPEDPERHAQDRCSPGGHDS